MLDRFECLACALWSCAVLTACGDVPPLGEGPDGGDTLDALVDWDAGPPLDAKETADASAPRCDPTAPFGEAVLVPELNSPSYDESARLTSDELTVYFSSARPGGVGDFDVYVATRSSIDEPFGAPSIVGGLNTAGRERSPTPTDDGLHLYVSTWVDDDWGLSRATRSSVAVPFGALSVVGELDAVAPAQEGQSYVLPDHRAVFYGSDMNGVWNLFRAPYDGMTFGAPLAISGAQINTSAYELFPVVTVDELTLVFVSTRPGGEGGWDIWMATRATTADGFGAPTNLSVLNGPAHEWPSWISTDGCVLYLTRYDPERSHEIMVTTRGS